MDRLQLGRGNRAPSTIHPGGDMLARLPALAKGGGAGVIR